MTRPSSFATRRQHSEDVGEAVATLLVVLGVVSVELAVYAWTFMILAGIVHLHVFAALAPFGFVTALQLAVVLFPLLVWQRLQHQD